MFRTLPAESASTGLPISKLNSNKLGRVTSAYSCAIDTVAGVAARNKHELVQS
jgi:hypothetical protein